MNRITTTRSVPVTTFVAKDEFQQRHSSKTPMYFGLRFAAIPTDATTPVPVKFEGLQLSAYALNQPLDDKTVLERFNTKAMEENNFWLLLYALIVNPVLGKKHFNYELSKKGVYVMHVYLKDGFEPIGDQLSSKAPQHLASIRIHWMHNEWNFYAGNYGDPYPWPRESTLLYLGAKK